MLILKTFIFTSPFILLMGCGELAKNDSGRGVVCDPGDAKCLEKDSAKASPTPTPTPTPAFTPVISAVDFNAGQYGGNNTIIITGSNFDSDAKVTFDVRLSSLVTVGNSGTTCTVVVPGGAAGAIIVKMVVSNPKSGLSTTARNYTYSGYGGVRADNKCKCWNCVTKSNADNSPADGTALADIPYVADPKLPGCGNLCKAKYGDTFSCNNPPQ